MNKNDFNEFVLLIEKALELNMRNVENIGVKSVRASVQLAIKLQIMTGKSYLDFIMVYKVSASMLYEIVGRIVNTLLKTLPRESITVK